MSGEHVAPEGAQRPDWRAVADMLYAALRRLDSETPNGLCFGHGDATRHAVQDACMAYEYACNWEC